MYSCVERHWTGPRVLLHALHHYAFLMKILMILAGFNLAVSTLTAKFNSPSNFPNMWYNTKRVFIPDLSDHKLCPGRRSCLWCAWHLFQCCGFSPTTVEQHWDVVWQSTKLEVALKPNHTFNISIKFNVLIFLFLQFIDLCILLGCDYCDSVKGIETHVTTFACPHCTHVLHNKV